ncbi:hypothetical protein ACFE04_012789 [Oxalis oulophora]
MEATSVLLHSKATTFGFFNLKRPNIHKPSLRHFNKHLQVNVLNTNKPIKNQPSSNLYPYPLLNSRERLRPSSSFVTNCTNSNSISQNLLKNSSFESLKAALLKVTPFNVVQWSALFAVAIAAGKWTLNLALNPFFWMYFSWTWLFWPWCVAVVLGVYGLFCVNKHLRGEASVFEQLTIVTSAFTWLTLVPPAHFNGYLEGWPFVFFFVYHYFFFFNVSVRRRLYGDYFARKHDPKWDVNPPSWSRLLFCVGVTVAHWLAAFEAPELHLIPGGWSNLGIWILIVTTLLVQYNSTLYLAKYSEKVVVPTAVVQFGPYRWVRHPIYASTILLFGTYFVAMRAPLSLLFLVGVCLMYYEQKAKMEEALMIDTFGERYLEYTSKVPHKFVPWIY